MAEAPRRSATGSAWGTLVALAALGVLFIPVLQPLLGVDLTCGYDNTFHLWRAIQIDRLWDGGVLYSRWAPDMAHGFGFPLFVFTSPFPPALVALLQRLGFAWSVALNATFGLGIVLGGLGMFWLTSHLSGAQGQGTAGRLSAGVVAAVAYVYAPFQAYDVFNRGSLWESFAWAFPPLVLLGLHRWMVDRERRYLLLGTGALAALVLSHHLFASLFAPVLALWVALHALTRRDWTVLWRGAQLGLLGLGLSAFFWLPPLAERAFVQTERLIGTWVFDYRYNFLSLDHLLALPRRADPQLVNDWPEKALGTVPVLLGLLPLASWRRLAGEARWRMGTLWLLTAGTAFLTLPASRWVWDGVSLLAYVQFPWRFLGPAAFCLALLTGTGVGSLYLGADEAASRAGWCPAAISLAVTSLLVMTNLGWFYPQHCSPISETSIAALIDWERMTDTLGTTAKGEYLPIWVHRFPETTLDADYARDGPVVRLRPANLPAGARIEAAAYGPLDAEIRLVTPAPFEARYLAFYYPGWEVRLNGEVVDIAPEAGTGLLTFDVPAGQHTVVVRFRETLLRRAATVASGLSLLALAAVVAWAPDRHRNDAGGDRCERTALNRYPPARLVLMLLAGAVALVALKSAVDARRWLWRSSRLTTEGALPDLAVPIGRDFGGQALLLGREALPATVAADAAPVLTLYWRALDPDPLDWHVGLALVGPDGSQRQAELRPARWARTPPAMVAWPADAYARMDMHIDLPPGLPPGEYRLALALFDRQTAAPASVLDAAGTPLGPALTIGQLVVQRPTAPPALAALGVADDARLQRCGALGFWKGTLSRAAVAPGDLVAVRMVWESLATPAEALEATLMLRDGDGREKRALALSPAAAWWPTDQWHTGDRWVGQAEMRLPGALETGLYTLELALEGCHVSTWEVQVTAPERRWQVPASLRAVEVAFADQVRLAGVRAAPMALAPGETLDVQLAWEALRAMETAYRVFVHLLDSDGQIVTQNDGEPADWMRPTTGWAVGEVVVEGRPLALPAAAPAGIYRVRVGIYAPDGQRLLTASGEDGVVVAEVRVR